MILIHREGGEPPPHQLSELQDKEAFAVYLAAEFTLVDAFNRAGQEIEIFQRK